jgi:hypothetical protein
VENAFVGTNQCFTCHRPQTDAWSETLHAQSHAKLPEQARDDSACLKCHVTGFDQPGGYAANTEKDLLMVGCEACHGPGERHVDAAQRFILATPDEEAKIEKEMRDTVVKSPSDSVCIACHQTQAHGAHPAYTHYSRDATGTSTLSGHGTADFARQQNSTNGPAAYSTAYSVKTCGSCHYEQYKTWRAERHAFLDESLPAKYQNDLDCRRCHLGRDGAGVNLAASSERNPRLIGAACESCHGPGLEHVRFNVRYITGPPLDAKLEQVSRQSIRKERPAASCIQCHVGQSHKQHPEFAKE